MTKSLLCKAVKQKHPNLTVAQIKLVVDLFFDEISQALTEKKRVELRGLGVFVNKVRSGRKARNPSTNEEIIVQDKNKVAFRIGKELFDRLNNKYT